MKETLVALALFVAYAYASNSDFKDQELAHCQHQLEITHHDH